jgi:hypothetical protein
MHQWPKLIERKLRISFFNVCFQITKNKLRKSWKIRYFISRSQSKLSQIDARDNFFWVMSYQNAMIFMTKLIFKCDKETIEFLGDNFDKEIFLRIKIIMNHSLLLTQSRKSCGWLIFEIWFLIKISRFRHWKIFWKGFIFIKN